MVRNWPLLLWQFLKNWFRNNGGTFSPSEHACYMCSMCRRTARGQMSNTGQQLLVGRPFVEGRAYCPRGHREQTPHFAIRP